MPHPHSNSSNSVISSLKQIHSADMMEEIFDGFPVPESAPQKLQFSSPLNWGVLAPQLSLELQAVFTRKAEL